MVLSLKIVFPAARAFTQVLIAGQGQQIREEFLFHRTTNGRVAAGWYGSTSKLVPQSSEPLQL